MTSPRSRAPWPVRIAVLAVTAAALVGTALVGGPQATTVAVADAATPGPAVATGPSDQPCWNTPWTP